MKSLALYRDLHKLLHSEEQFLTVKGRKYIVEISRGLRYVRVENEVLAQQDPQEQTSLARRSNLEPITRIIRVGKKWGWISNSEIVDPTLN